jgi:hypothetical protein
VIRIEVGFVVITAVAMEKLYLHGYSTAQSGESQHIFLLPDHAGFLLDLTFGPENGDDIFLRNISHVSFHRTTRPYIPEQTHSVFDML